MKLTKVAFSVVALAAAVVVGGSWYTGKQAEQRYQEYIDKLNVRLKAANFGEIKESSFERHFFSSDVRYTMAINVGEKTLQLTDNGQLFHGPFPYNQLKKGHFMPALASLESHVQIPESHFLKKAVALNVDSVFGYDGKIATTVPQTDLDIDISDSETVSFRGLSVNGRYDDSDFNSSGTVDIQQVALKDRHSSHEMMRFDKLAFNIKSESPSAYPGLDNWDMDGNIGEIKLDDGRANLVKLSQLTFDVVEKNEGERHQGKTKINTQFEMIQGDVVLKLNNILFDMDYNADSKALNDLMLLSQNLSQGNDGNIDEHTEDLLYTASLNLLKKALRFNVNHFRLENSQGKVLDLLLKMDLKGADWSQFSGVEDVLGTFNQLQLNGKTEFDALHQFLSGLEQLSGADKESAQETSKEGIDQMVNIAKILGYTTVTDKDLLLQVSVENGKLKVGDREISASQLDSLLSMLLSGQL